MEFTESEILLIEPPDQIGSQKNQAMATRDNDTPVWSTPSTSDPEERWPAWSIQ
jgi:hypothetical protein